MSEVKEGNRDLVLPCIMFLGGIFIGTQVDWAINLEVERRALQKEYAFEKSLNEIEANRIKEIEADVDSYMKRICP